MPINTIVCESIGHITGIVSNLIEKHSKSPAILPAGASVFEMHICSIAGELTPNRAIRIGNNNISNYYTGADIYGISTNVLNDKQNISLFGINTDFFGQSASKEPINLTVRSGFIGNIIAGRISVVLKYKTSQVSNPVPGVDIS